MEAKFINLNDQEPESNQNTFDWMQLTDLKNGRYSFGFWNVIIKNSANSQQYLQHDGICKENLFNILHDAGYRLFVEPAAQAVHYYDHHPGKDAMMSRGWHLYHAKHFQGRLRTRLAEWLEHHAAPGPAFPPELQPIPGEPICLPVSGALQAGWVLEVSPALNFVPAIGRIGHGPHAEIPAECWQRFTGGRYFARLGSPNSAPELQRCWSWLN